MPRPWAERRYASTPHSMYQADKGLSQDRTLTKDLSVLNTLNVKR
jgi:hypothetical protein